MNLQDYLAALRSHWVLLMILFVLGGGGGYAYAQTVDPMFRSQTQVIVIPTRGDSTVELVQGSNYVQSVVQTYTILASSPTVLQPVIDRVGVDETVNRLARRVDVSVPLDTVVIEIGVVDDDPELARRTADEIAHQLSVAVANVSPLGEDDEPAVRIETITPARAPSIPISPNTRRIAALGAGVGVATGVGVALFRRQFLSRATTAESLTQTGYPVLGEIPASSESRSIAQVIHGNPDSRMSEAVRKTAASLQLLNLERPAPVLMVTSGTSAEGKTSVSLALSMSLAEAGKTVLYLEADMRRPGAASSTQLDSSVGLSSVLIGQVSLADAVQRWGRGNLEVLTCGPPPPNPGRVLASGELGKIISEARARYDHVIVDSAPVLSVSDALWLSEVVDASVVVVRAHRTRLSDAARTIDALEATRAPVLGIILNGLRRSSRSPYYSDYARQRGSRTNGRFARLK